MLGTTPAPGTPHRNPQTMMLVLKANHQLTHKPLEGCPQSYNFYNIKQ